MADAEGTTAASEESPPTTTEEATVVASTTTAAAASSSAESVTPVKTLVVAAAATTSAAPPSQGDKVAVVTATATTTGTATPVKILTASTTSTAVAGVPGVVTVSSGLTSPKDNSIIFVMNKAEPGTGTSGGGGQEVKLMTKPLMITSPTGVAGTAAILKKGSIVGNTIVKVQQQKVGSPQGSPLIGKKSVMIAARGGVNQLIGTVVQQHSQGSTPVVLTQKVAAGGIATSPVVSTGRVTAAIANLAGGAKILTTATGASGGGTAQQQQSQQRLQDVRVDNWGNYCLQRLQTMYDKGDYCDLTLRFHSSQEIKVHRVVVNLCTEYFSNLEKLYGLNEGTLILPKDVEFQTMQTIIKFFYTGKLEVRGTQFNDIYRTVKMMNITILIKLLEAHSRKPAALQMKKDAGRSAVVLKQAVELGKGETGQVQIQVATANQPQTSSPVIAVPVAGAGAKALQVAAPGVKLPPGMKTKTVLARVQSQSPKGQAATKTTPKKLPIWKERKYTPVTQEPPKLEKWQIKAEEPARPTRFEWGDPDADLDPFMNPPTLTNHALMEKQKEKHSTVRKAEDIFDTVKSKQNQAQSSGTKRPKSPESNTPKAASPNSEPPAKVPKLAENETVVSGSSEVETETIVDSAVDPLSLEETPESVPEGQIVEEVATTSTPTLTLNENKQPEKKPVPILKPALKSPHKGTKTGADGKDGTPQKTVRFAPEVEKENKEKPSTSSAVNVVAATTSTPTPTTPTPSTSVVKKGPVTSDGGDFNHSKIISEVLRKFPDLVKDNKNIKLKIVQKAADGSTITTKDSKSKVSYIVLKSTSSPDASTSTTVLKKSPAQSSVSKFWEQDKTPKKPSPAENITGPWLCERCGEGENTAIQFDTYYSFRRHLVEVHQERIDARICEYCGQKASKRNLLLYHLYTKHGVQPPKNCTFPHCDRCDYVALSESLLNKHKQNHDNNKEFCCLICNASFKTANALQGHMTANLHRNKDTKVYECPYCRKPFVRNINLKAHIRSLHRDVARMEEMEDPRLPPPEDNMLGKRFLATAGTGKKRGFPSILTTARAGTSTSGLVELISADDMHTVSYVTEDGQPIEIIDPSQLTSLPLTMVSSIEDGMATITTPVTTAMGVEAHTTNAATTEYITSAAHDSSQQVYVMDGAQGAMEIDMASMGLTLASDGSMVFEGEDPSQNFLVQDMQGNQYRRITGIDETGKPVMFLQMVGDGGQVGMTQGMLDGSGNSQQMFVASDGMSIPVTSDTDGQVIFASEAPDGTFVEMVPENGTGHHQVVMGEAVVSSQQQEINEQPQHLQLVQHDQNSEQLQEVQQHDQMGQPVQELHLVLDQQNSKEEEVQEQIVAQDDGMEIVEVQAPETFSELQIVGQYGDTSIETTEEVADETSEQAQQEGDVDQQVVSEEGEQQEMEIDENSQQLQIDEGPEELKIQSNKDDAISQEEVGEGEGEETQVVTADEDNLQQSIELVEGQTLTLIEDEEETQRIEEEEVTT